MIKIGHVSCSELQGGQKMNSDTQKRRAVLIVGASSGIGRACAESMADSENILYLVARNKEALKEMQECLPGVIHILPHDLNDIDGIKNIFDRIKKDRIKLNGFVYSAGMDSFSPAKVISIKSMQNVMNINCFAFCECTRCFFNRRISEDGASIVAISSIASVLFEKGQMAYTASKAALNSVVKTMSQEFAGRRIRVNAILPAGVATTMADSKGMALEGMYDAEDIQTPAPQRHTQNWGAIPPSIIAENVNFLLSDASAYTTGELLTIGAGYSY